MLMVTAAGTTNLASSQPSLVLGTTPAAAHSDNPADGDTLFAIGSNSKSFTATILAMLEDEVLELNALVDLYEALAIEDIRQAADVLRPAYEQSEGLDGYVSLEVSPVLAYKTEETVAAAKRLFKSVNPPNVMMKVPATAAGLPAITAWRGRRRWISLSWARCWTM